MVASFREVVGLTTETIVNFYRHHNKVGRYVGLNEEPRTTWKPEKGHELTKILQAVVNSTVRKIRVDYWRRTLELPEVRERLTQKRRSEFEEKLKAKDTMDFTESNIRQFLLNLIAGYSKTLQDGVDEVFDLMTKRHCYDDGLRTENIHYFNGWKTNSAYRVGQKVILPIRSAYGFCQGFEPEASRSGPVSENTQNATCNEKTNQPDHAYTPVVKNANEGA